MTQPAPELPGYRFERLLGSGGYSDVYLYRQQLPSRPVAVKVLRSSGLPEDQRAKFTAEANAMAGLADHPNIVPVFSAAVSADGRPYIVMQYYSNPNLSVRAASERLAVAEVVRVGIQIGSAVETAHRAGILHRDIKPANLLISQYGAPGLTDFGIAGQMAELDDDEDTGVSVPWTAPEVLYASGPTSVRSDVYGLAATLWHLLVGRSPFEQRNGDNSTFALMRRVRDSPPPSTGRADVPDSLDRLLRQSMGKDPGSRPATAIEFARRLQAVEQELQLPRTEIVVTSDSGVGTPQADAPPSPYSTAPLTVARPLAVSTQAPVEEGPRHPDGIGAPPTDARPAVFAAQDVDPGRIRYGPAGTPDRARVVSAPEPAARRAPGPLIAAAVVVAGLAVGAGFVLSSLSGGEPRPPTSTLSQSVPTQNAGIPGPDSPPGVPKIAGRRVDGVAVFTWTYSARQTTDSFVWREVDGRGRSGTVTTSRLRLRPVAGAARTCVEVRVVRADGTNASATFSPEGCA